MSSKTPVVLFRADGYSALGVVRSLGRLGVPVYCIDHDPACLAARSRFCTERVSWNLDANSDETTIDFLVRLAGRFPGPPVLLPAGDRNSLLAERYFGRLTPHYLLPNSQPGAASALHNKQSLCRLAHELSVPTPETHFPQRFDELLAMGDKLGFPLVVKVVQSARREAAHECHFAVARNPAELEGAFRAAGGAMSGNVLLQSYIAHGDDDRGFVSAYYDGRGKRLFGATGIKLRQLPIHGGDTTMSICRRLDLLLKTVDRIVAAAGYSGIIDVDFCHDSRDGLWKLLDVNPRYGANFRALTDRNGLDAVRALYLDLTGQSVHQAEPAWGRRWMVEDKDFWALREHMREGSLTVAEWLASIRPNIEFAYWSMDDLGPSLRAAAGFMAGYVRLFADRVRRRFATRLR